MSLKYRKIYTIGLAVLILAGLGFLLYSRTAVQAQIPSLLKFQGKVTETDGSELIDGNYDFSFRLYTSPTGGSSIWSEDVTAANRFSATIGSAVDLGNGIKYTYSGGSATTTLRLGQYLSIATGTDAALIMDYGIGTTTITVASGSPLWAAGQTVNNRPWVEGGIVDINLGSVTDISSVDFNQNIYLEVEFNSEVMQPRKVLTTSPYAFEAGSLGGKTESELASLSEDETITGEWNFNNVVDIATSSNNTALTVTQSGSGNIVEFGTSTGAVFTILADGRVQIGDYRLPADSNGASPGYVLKYNASGDMYWDEDFVGGFGSGGGDMLWATNTLETLIRPINTALIVVVGNVATSTMSGQIFEVQGSSLFDTVNISNQQQLRLYDADSSNYIALRSTTTLGSNLILSLPGNYGSDGQFLTTDGSGNLTWSSSASQTVYVNPGMAGQMAYYAGAGSNLNATNTIFISPAGNIGIGTSSPASLLTVGAISGSQFRINTSGQVVSGTWQGTTVGVAYGGTGTTTFEANSILFAPSDDTVSEILAGINGQVLKMVGGVPVWQTDLTVGGELTHWATSSDDLLIHPTNINRVVVVGAIATTSANVILEVAGNALFSGSISAQDLSLVNALSVANGGTGSTSLSGLLYGDGAGNIVSVGNNSANWNTAFSWGDHSGAGYFDTDTDLLTIALGGTGTTTFSANAIIYASGVNTISEILPGQEGQTLIMSGGQPTWAASSTGAAHPLLSIAHTDTNAAAVARGDLVLGQGASPTWARLALGTTGYVLRSDGTDASWSPTSNITELGTIATGTWQGTTIGVAYGGTGTTTFEAGSILYAPGDDTVSEILAGSNGYALKMVGGVPTWQPDLTLGGEISLWASSSDNLMIHPTNINQVVVVGNNATTSNNVILEVAGNALFSGSISAQDLSLVNSLSVAYGGTGSGTPSGLLYGDGAGNIVSVGNNTSDWNTAFSWGDHSGAGYFDTDTDLLSIALGGTGTTTFSAYSLLYASAINTIGEILPGSDGQTLIMSGGRPVWAASSTGASHDLLSTSHTDTTPAAVQRGDVMVGQGATPSWARLALGTTGYILRSDGTDASWAPTINITELGTITAGAWQGDIIDITRGGTGASTTEAARANLGLSEAFKFSVNSTGTVGWLWQSDGDGRGGWIATSALGLMDDRVSRLIGTTTSTHNGEFATSTLRGYTAANDMCNAEFTGSYFCRTYDILVTVQEADISGWGRSAWIAEGPPGYTSNSNDCNGWTASSSIMLGAFWAFDPNGGAGWLTNCSGEKPLACCKRQ